MLVFKLECSLWISSSLSHNSFTFLLLFQLVHGHTCAVKSTAQEETSDLGSFSHQWLMVGCERFWKQKRTKYVKVVAKNIPKKKNVSSKCNFIYVKLCHLFFKYFNQEKEIQIGFLRQFVEHKMSKYSIKNSSFVCQHGIS